MNPLSIVYAAANVGLGYLVVNNSPTLFRAIVYYVVGSILVRFVLSKAGAREPASDIILWAGAIFVAYLFYKKYGVKGALASFVGPLILGVVGLLLIALVVLSISDVANRTG